MQVTEKSARRFDRFEQCLMRHLAEPEIPCRRLQSRMPPPADHFEKIPE